MPLTLNIYMRSSSLESQEDGRVSVLVSKVLVTDFSWQTTECLPAPYDSKEKERSVS